MQKKYAKDGMAAVSVDLDDPAEKDIKDRVLKFLESQNATFPNIMLDEKPAVWQKNLGIDGVPAVFIYGRDGSIAKKFTDDYTYEDVEKVVVELLKKK
jgi:hypothetical protein